MRCIFVQLFLVFNLFGEQMTLVVGEWGLFSSVHQERNGIIPEIVEEACRNAGVELKVEFRAWSRAMELVKTGYVVDATAPWSKTPEREKDFYFSIPIVEEIPTLFFDQSKHTNLQSLTSYDAIAKSGLRYIGLSGYLQTDELQKRNMDVLITTDSRTAWRFIELGRADLYVDDYYAGLSEVQKYAPKLNKSLGFVRLESHINDTFILFTKNERGKKLRDLLNPELQRMKAKGEFTRIIEKYLQSGVKDAKNPY